MIDRQQIRNPFDRDVVTDPGTPAQTDVPAIHGNAFKLCTVSYNRVATERCSWSVLLNGEAGCGKTHLLARLRHWLAGEFSDKPIVPAALFVGVRMETGPGQIWRHLRRRFAEELMRRHSNGSTNLDCILDNFARQYGSDLSHAFETAPLRETSIDLVKILEQYASSHQRRLCRAWLAGDGLSDTDLQVLNLPPLNLSVIEEDSAESDARRMVLAVTRLAEPLPVVFCFDQIEALRLSENSKSFGAFSRMGASLIDETGNSVLISTILVTFLNDFRDGSTISDFQRIAKETADLQPLDFSLGKQLVEARLRSVPELAGQEPLPESDLQAFYKIEKGRVNPRRLIYEARRLFTKWQDKPAEVQLPVDDFLDQEFERLWAASELRRASSEADEVLSHSLPVALALAGASFGDRLSKHADLSGSREGRRISIALGNQVHMASLAAWLRKLQQETPKEVRLCILRDERLPISARAKAAQTRLQEIEQSGGAVVRVDVEALAALDAMRRLLSAATSGDLSNSGKTVEAKTVREWLARNLPKSVTAFVDQVAGAVVSASSPAGDALFELLEKAKIVSLEEAVRVTNLRREQIEDYARTHPHRVGLFGGRSPVVCHAIRAAANGAASEAG